MNKDYKQIEFTLGYTVEQAVNELLKRKEKGQLASGKFNGIMLYSDTVTFDSAYQEIIGKTKSKFDKEQQEWKDNYDRKEKEHKEEIPELSLVWMKKGREVLTEDKWEYWDKIVPIRLSDLYKGMELNACLEIVSILNNNGTLNEAKDRIDSQDHSGMSFGLVCSMIKEFSDRGSDFAEYVK